MISSIKNIKYKYFQFRVFKKLDKIIVAESNFIE